MQGQDEGHARRNSVYYSYSTIYYCQCSSRLQFDQLCGYTLLPCVCARMDEHSHFTYFIMKLDSLKWYVSVGVGLICITGRGWAGRVPCQSEHQCTVCLMGGHKATTNKHDSPHLQQLCVQLDNLQQSCVCSLMHEEILYTKTHKAITIERIPHMLSCGARLMLNNYQSAWVVFSRARPALCRPQSCTCQGLKRVGFPLSRITT